jgi:hypothetical protein
VPTYADTVSLIPTLHTGAELVDCPDDFVSRNARIRNARKQPLFRHHVTVANATRLDANPNLSLPCLWDLPLDNFEISTGPGYLHSFHLRHSASPRSLHCNEVAIPTNTHRTLICQRFDASWTFNLNSEMAETSANAEPTWGRPPSPSASRSRSS